MKSPAQLCALLALGLVACPEESGQRSPDAATDGGVSVEAGDADASAAGDATSTDRAITGCAIDQAQPPWPSWVPPWPGAGRNATGNTQFTVLDDGPSISDLRVERQRARSAVVAWTTLGDCDSSVAWGLSADSCPHGYHRTGARREHRMVVGPLEPETEYHVVVRSRDDSQSDQAALTFTTPAPTAATELSSCGVIDVPGSYRLTADVTAGCTCFDIQASGVELDLGWHQVTYAETDGVTQCHGVSARADEVEVARGVVVQGAAGGGPYSHAVAGRSAAGLEFHQLWIRVHSSDAFGLRTMYAGDVSVHDLLVVSEVQEVTDRHYPGNRGVALDLAPAGAVGEVYDCALFGVPHWGIMLTNGDEAALDARPSTGQLRRISNNHVFADMHATNGYALGVHAHHVEVDHNEIRPLHNGRAIHYTAGNGHLHHNIVEAVELIAGEVSLGYAYYSDLADASSPHDLGVCTWVVAHGVRVEGGSYGLINNNEVYAYSLPSVSFGSTALNISTAAGARGGNEVHHNQFTAYRDPASAWCDEWGGPLPTMAGWVRGETPTEAAQLHDNRFVSSDETLSIEVGALATSINDELVVR